MENKKNNWKKFWTKAGKFLNVGWKVALVTIGTFCVIVILIVVRELGEEHCGKSAHYWDRHLSENIGVHRFDAGGVRLYDFKGAKYISPKMKWVSEVPSRDSLAVFCDKQDKRGFLNVNTGEVVVESKYERAWVFSEGLAAVVEPGGKLGFIDHTGEYVIAPELEYISNHDYVFKHGVCCIENKERYQGLINREGEWVLPQEYYYIDYVAETDMFIPNKDEKSGLMKNGSFEWVYPVEYDDISWVNAPTGAGFILYKDFCSNHVSADGTVIDEFLIDETSELRYMTNYHSGEADEYSISDKVIAFRVYRLWGVMDKHTGKVLIPAMYGSVEMVSEDILMCSLEQNQYDDYVLYDLKGQKINN